MDKFYGTFFGQVMTVYILSWYRFWSKSRTLL